MYDHDGERLSTTVQFEKYQCDKIKIKMSDNHEFL